MNRLIEETDVSIVNLSLELERAVIEHRLQEDEKLYVIEQNFFPFWVQILKTPCFVSFTTYLMFRENTTLLQRLELTNQFNQDTYMSSAHVVQNMLRIEHVLTYKNGILSETFIRGCRQYSGGISLFISEYDPDYKLLMQLTESATQPDDFTNEEVNNPEAE